MRTSMVAALACLTLLGACSQSSAPGKPLAIPSSLEQPPTTAPGLPDDALAPKPVDMAQVQPLVPIHLVMLDDDGAHGEPLGCGDSLVVYQAPNPGGATFVEQSMRALIAQPASFPGPDGELTNIVTGLAYESDTIADGVLTIRLTGQPLIGGMCDAPRLQAQVERTALAAAQLSSIAPASSVVVLLNGSADEWNALFNFKGI